MRIIKYAVTVSLLGAVAFGYQNCAPAGGHTSDVGSTASSSAVPVAGQKTVYADLLPIFAGKCANCHSQGGNSFMTYQTLMASNYVVTGLPNLSPLYGAVASGSMPRSAPRLSTAEINLIQKWILDGALEKASATPTPAPTPH